MLIPGTVLGDRYEILEKIGTGGMADVYKAKCHKLNRFVAIKVLKDEFAENKSFVAKFRQEAQAAAGLMHPNIVNVYDVGDEDGLYYFVMELVEGITLKKYIEKKIRLSVKEAVSIAIQVAMGIESAHNNGIIHRDIKPQNIIISKEGKVKVADFGIARAASSDTQTSHAMGSVHYTSPEQARGGYSDAKSDIYSIGITLFEMVTGRVPFDGETTVAIAIKHIQEEMPSPRVYVPEIPVSVEQIIFKCTQKNPDRRYQNVSELMQDLKHSLISPNENFVVINDAKSSEGTKTLTDADRREIINQTSSNMYAGTDFNPNQYGNSEQYYGQNGYGNQPYNQNYGNGGYGRDQYNGAPYQEGYNQGYGPNGYPDARYDGGYNDQYRNMQYDNGPDGDMEDPYNVMDPRAAKNRKPKKPQDDRTEGRKGANGPKNSQGKNGNQPRKNGQNKNRKPNDDYYSAGKNKQKKRDYYEVDNEKEVDPKMEKVMSVLMIVAAVIITIIAILVVGKVLGIVGSSDSDGTQVEEGMTVVPNVVGLSLEEASAALKEANLTAKASYAESTQFDKDYIDSQDPAAGEHVPENSILTLVVSSGKVAGTTDITGAPTENVGGAAVPDVVGKSEAEARVAIEAEGFVFTLMQQESATVEKGMVISQSPLGATTAPKGSSVQVYISSGSSIETVQVPNVEGTEEVAAKAKLEEAGLTVTSAEENSDTVPKGSVISQSVASGTTVDKGSSITIKVSKGPNGYTCNCTVQAPADYLEGSDAIIVLMDAAGAEIQRFSTSSFPYTAVKTGITSSATGVITVTYQSNDGQWQTSAPSTVNFSKE